MILKLTCYTLLVCSFALLFYTFSVPSVVDRYFYEACAFFSFIAFLRLREKLA